MCGDAGHKDHIGGSDSQEVLHKGGEHPPDDKHVDKDSEAFEAREHNKILRGYILSGEGEDLSGDGELREGFPPQSDPAVGGAVGRGVGALGSEVLPGDGEGVAVQYLVVYPVHKQNIIHRDIKT